MWYMMSTELLPSMRILESWQLATVAVMKRASSCGKCMPTASSTVKMIGMLAHLGAKWVPRFPNVHFMNVLLTAPLGSPSRGRAPKDNIHNMDSLLEGELNSHRSHFIHHHH